MPTSASSTTAPTPSVYKRRTLLPKKRHYTHNQEVIQVLKKIEYELKEARPRGAMARARKGLVRGVTSLGAILALCLAMTTVYLLYIGVDIPSPTQSGVFFIERLYDLRDFIVLIRSGGLMRSFTNAMGTSLKQAGQVLYTDNAPDASIRSQRTLESVIAHAVSRHLNTINKKFADSMDRVMANVTRNLGTRMELAVYNASLLISEQIDKSIMNATWLFSGNFNSTIANATILLANQLSAQLDVSLRNATGLFQESLANTSSTLSASVANATAVALQPLNESLAGLQSSVDGLNETISRGFL